MFDNKFSFNCRLGRKRTMIYFHSICGTALIIATILTTTSGEIHVKSFYVAKTKRFDIQIQILAELRSSSQLQS